MHVYLTKIHQFDVRITFIQVMLIGKLKLKTMHLALFPNMALSRPPLCVTQVYYE